MDIWDSKWVGWWEFT